MLSAPRAPCIETPAQSRANKMVDDINKIVCVMDSSPWSSLQAKSWLPRCVGTVAEKPGLQLAIEAKGRHNFNPDFLRHVCKRSRHNFVLQCWQSKEGPSTRRRPRWEVPRCIGLPSWNPSRCRLSKTNSCMGYATSPARNVDCSQQEAQCARICCSRLARSILRGGTAHDRLTNVSRCARSCAMRNQVPEFLGELYLPPCLASTVYLLLATFSSAPLCRHRLLRPAHAMYLDSQIHLWYASRVTLLIVRCLYF
jgi:hypothetical protein